MTLAMVMVLKDKRITSVVLGVSKPQQLTDSIKCLMNYNFSPEEIDRIENTLR